MIKNVRLTSRIPSGNIPPTNTSVLTTKNRISLPNEVVAAARRRLNDEIFWTVDRSGELHGRKLEKAFSRPGRMVSDRQTGLVFWRGDVTDAEAEEAALQANLSRHD
jgi:hypothetical protein